MKLYHIALTKNVQSILQEGLRVDGGMKGLATYKTERSLAVWLTDNVDYIVEHQVGLELFTAQCSVLEVNVTGMLLGALAVYPTGNIVICKHEYFVTKDVEPYRISMA